MSTRTLEAPDMKDVQAEPPAPAPACSSMLPLGTKFGDAVYYGLAAISATWAGLVLRVYGAYCRTAVEQSQAAFAQFQKIGLNLASEVPAAVLVPVKIHKSQHEHAARPPDRATRGCLP